MQNGKQERQRGYKNPQKSEVFKHQDEKEQTAVLLFNSEEGDRIKKKEISD